MFAIVHETIDSNALQAAVAHPEAGAIVTFDGTVRNHNEGKTVLRLEYEAYSSLAHHEAKKIMAEAQARFPILKMASCHRVGGLEIGEVAVTVAVSTAHRCDAFHAAMYLMDNIKARLPIWKKEHYVDEPAIWVNCQGCRHAHTHGAETTKDHHPSGCPTATA